MSTFDYGTDPCPSCKGPVHPAMGRRYNGHCSDACRNHTDCNAAEAALQELVDLKALKDREGKTPEYESRVTAAWARAREVLGMTDDEESAPAPSGRCKVCDGLGVRAYSDTAQGLGGAGGQMMTSGPCRECDGGLAKDGQP